MLKKILLTAALFTVWGATAGTAGRSANLLSGDPDAEQENQGVTSGPFSNRHLKAPRWEVRKDGGVGSKSYIHLIKPGTGMATRPIKLEKGVHTFSFYAKADAPGKSACRAVNTVGSNWGRVLRARAAGTFKVDTEWKRYSITFEADGNQFYSGYYGNIQSGVSFDRFMINKGDTALPWVPPCEYSVLVTPCDKTDRVFFLNTPARAEIKLTRYVSKDSGKKLKIEIRDFYGKTYYSALETPNFVNAAGAAVFTKKLQLPTAVPGWYRISAVLEGTDFSDWNSYAVVNKPETPAPGAVPFVGLCGARDKLNGSKMIGVRWMQHYIPWYQLEAVKGKYDFSELEEARKLKKMGFAMQALITSGVPVWAIPSDMARDLQLLKVGNSRVIAPQALLESSFRPLMRQVMTQYADVFDVFELGGELDALLGLNVYYKSRDNKNIVSSFVLGESYEGVCRMMEIAAQEILRVKPDARISACRPSDVDARRAYVYSREIFKKLGKYLNCFGIDCYPQPRWVGPGQPPTGSEQDLLIRQRDARAAMKGLVKGEDVIISEYGYFIDHRKVNDFQYASQHANRIARSFLKARLIGMKALHYYSASGDSLEGKHYHMGIWFQGKPLPAVAALSTVAGIVENVEKCEEIKLNTKTAIGVFKKFSGEAAAAIWSLDDKFSPEIELNDDKFILTDALGAPLPRKSLSSGRIVFKLTPLPVYIRRNEKNEDNYAKLVKTMRNIRIAEEMPVTIHLRQNDAKSLKAYVLNNSVIKAVNGSAGYVLDGKKEGKVTFQVSPGKQQLVYFPMPEKEIQMTFNFAGPYKTSKLVFKTPENAAVCKTAPIRFRENIAPWKHIKPIRISGRERIHPVDHTTYEGAADLSADIYLAHDGKYFYFAADVTDDKHFNRYSASSLWKGDCVQLGFDPEMNFIRDTNGFDRDDIMLSCGLLSSGAGLVVHTGPGKFSLQSETEYKVTRCEKTRKTLYQIRIPLALIGKNLKKGSVFGFNCIFMDDDTNSAADYWLFLRQGLAGGIRPDKFLPCVIK